MGKRGLGIFFRSPVVHDGGFKYSYMMLGWFKIVGLVLLAGALLSGCARFNAEDFGFDAIQTISEIDASTEENLGKRVIVEGYVAIKIDNVLLYEKPSGETTYLCLRSKILHGDKGFHRKKVVLSGLFKEGGNANLACTVYLTDINVLYIY